MQLIQSKPDIHTSYRLSRIAEPERLVFFDIETTGISAQHSRLYLIGALHYEAGSWELLQFFSEYAGDEAALLSGFFGLLDRKKQAARLRSGRSRHLILLHYNGDMFDIPYLKNRIAALGLSCGFTGTLSLDLYQKAKPYKAFLGLSDCKLKSVERALSISREDPFSGGELIFVYQEYLRLRNLIRNDCQDDPDAKAHAEALQKTLLLHNAEDLANLPAVCGVLAYEDLFSGQFALKSAELVRISGKPVLNLYFRVESALPLPLDLEEGPYVLSVETDRKNGETILNLAVSLFEGRLRFYFENYREYDYLPLEDMAVHKSVGQFTARSFRRQATAATCYQWREGLFLPRPGGAAAQLFYEGSRKGRAYTLFQKESVGAADAAERFTAYALETLKLFQKTRRGGKRS